MPSSRLGRDLRARSRAAKRYSKNSATAIAPQPQHWSLARYIVRIEPDPAKRRQLLRDAVKYIAENALNVGLLYPTRADLLHPYVRGYYPHVGNKANYAFSWLQK